jgi:ribosomal protein L7/L12
MTISDTSFEELRQQVIQLSSRVAMLEREVEFLLSHDPSAYTDQAPAQAYPDVVDLKRKGKIIDAIAAYRRHTNSGLVEAKAYVDRLEV